jgi:hypothetical protein
MSNTNLAKKRKSQVIQPTLNSSFVFGEDIIQQIKVNIREDLQLLYEKQVEEFNQVNGKLNYLEEQLRTIQTEMKILLDKTQSSTKAPQIETQAQPEVVQQERSPVDRRTYDSDAIFQSYLT